MYTNSKKIMHLVHEHTSQTYATDYFADFGIPVHHVLHTVFRPDKSFSGQYLARVLKTHPETYQNKSVLDMGCGTGLLGIICAMQGASSVFFSDVNPVVVENVLLNSKEMKLENIGVVSGDLFENIGKKRFDVIIFNPPGFSGNALNYIEATLVSPNRLIDKFFTQAPMYLSKIGRIIMPTSSLHDPDRTPFTLAKKYGYSFEILDEHKTENATQYTVMVQISGR